MKKFILTALMLLSSAAVSNATLLTFDDLNTGGAGQVQSSYAGLTFNGWWHVDNPPYGYPYESAPTVIYNSESAYTNVPEIIFGSLVDVQSVYLAGFDIEYVTLLGYSGSSLLYSSTVDVESSMSHYTLDFIGIDKFVMQTTSGTFAFLDDFEYQANNANAPVPEPGTIMLLGVGMAGLAIYGKRRKNNKA